MARIFDKLGWVIAALVSLAALAALAGLVSAGPLDPTAPPGSTDKTVITSLPWTISQPGSYVLKSNLTGVSGQRGIRVVADDVTIDLQGFELKGIPGALSGIDGSGAPGVANLTVQHGTVRDWPQIGIAAGTGAVVDDVRVLSNGFGMQVGHRSSVSNCLVENSTASAIVAGAGDGVRVDNCRVESNNISNIATYAVQLGQDAVITDTVARNNGGVEIQAGTGSTLENCIADGNNTAGNGIEVGNDSVIRGCTSRNNGGHEIVAGNQVVMEDCVAEGFTGSANGSGDGIVVGSKSTVRSCSATNNAGRGIVSVGYGVTLESCVAVDNSGSGIALGDDSIVSGCTARNNGSSTNDNEIGAGNGSLIEDCVADGFTGTNQGAGSGIRILSRTVVRGCVTSLNLGAGIQVDGTGNRIEGNHMANNQIGINVFQDRNLIAQNSAWSNNQADYNVPAGNQYEPAGAVAGDTNPWANATQ